MNNINDISPLLLAYLGDSVMEVMVRKHLIEKYPDNAKCNKAALDFVTADSQRKALENVIDLFTEDEKSVFTRGKNAKSHSNPKNTDVYTYRLATGFEAVFGYNQLLGNSERNEFLFNTAYMIDGNC